MPRAELDPHSRRLRDLSAADERCVTEEAIRRARRTYYGNVSYVDEWVGRILAGLEESGRAEDTIAIFLADHGDMLGDRGLWYKMSFLGPSVRVPMIVHAPKRFAHKRVTAPVSLVDLLPTMLALAGGDVVADPPTALDGDDLSTTLTGAESLGDRVVFAEYLGEGSVAPCLMVRQGTLKLIHCPIDPPQLFDLATDPDERINLAEDPAQADTLARFMGVARDHWDSDQAHRKVIADQRRRRLLDRSRRKGEFQPWDFQPHRDASQIYMRNHLDLNQVEECARFPPHGPGHSKEDIGE